MRNRLWSYIILGAILATISVILSSLSTSNWIVFALIITSAVVFALIQGALRDPTEAGDVDIPEPQKALPTGFGRAMLEQMPLPLLVISPKGRVVYGNRAAHGLLPNLEKGEHFANLFRAPIFVDAVNAAIAEGESRKVSFTAGNTDEKYYEARIGLLPAGSEFGDTVQAIVEIEDRTQTRRVEKMRSDFVANASHELRTPLASILGYIETLQGHAKNDPVAREEFLKIMSKQATRMHRLVDDLMSLSKIELNEHVRPDVVCGYNDLAQEAIASLLPLQEKYKVVLENALAETGPDVHADRDQINQVLVNLIVNAMKYGGEGKVVSVSTATVNQRYSGMTGITIADQGAGIAPEHLHRLTERFYRVSATISRNKGGTGLGLAIVKHIVNRHGGELQIESTLGQGSQFTVWLPKI